MTTAMQPITTNSNPFEIANPVSIFNHPDFGFVRVVVKDGEPWFVGKDVAEVLGYKNTRDALAKHTDYEDRDSVVFRDGTSGNPYQIIINESGLYSLMLRSKLPQAHAFKRWVTSEVLPSNRKHGGYLTPDKLEEALLSPDTLINLALFPYFSPCLVQKQL